jgi:hypothetical protein
MAVMQFDKFLWLWRIKLRSLAFSKSDREGFFLHIGHVSQSEREVVDWVKANIHSPEWWRDYLIIDLEIIGKLWAVGQEEK